MQRLTWNVVAEEQSDAGELLDEDEIHKTKLVVPRTRVMSGYTPGASVSCRRLLRVNVLRHLAVHLLLGLREEKWLQRYSKYF